jgi:hypothetical protein
VKQALERRGHVVDIAFREDKVSGPYNVVISLRGLVPHTPVPSSLNVLWSISHPDLLTMDEIDAYDLFFSASLTWPGALAWAREGVNHTLLQATDRARFYPRASRSGAGEDVLFVGNTRGVDRWIVKQAVAAGLRLGIYGTGWTGRVPDTYVRDTYLPNESLVEYYGDAAVVLNDHWESMRRFG